MRDHIGNLLTNGCLENKIIFLRLLGEIQFFAVGN